MKQQTTIVEERMVQIVRNLVNIHLEFEARAFEYHDQCTKLRKDAQKQLKKLEAKYYK
jgi:hypothetical protein